jgi:hypothetical protein
MGSQASAIDKVRQGLQDALRRVEDAQRRPGAYGFLAAIARVLTQMLASLDGDREMRDRIAGGLGRLVTDDYSFSESELGQELLRLADDFALL